MTTWSSRRASCRGNLPGRGLDADYSSSMCSHLLLDTNKYFIPPCPKLAVSGYDAMPCIVGLATPQYL